MATITAVGIKNIWYADPAKVTGDLTGTLLGTILKDPTTKKVPNVHQDTWSLDEAEPSTTQYKNQLTDGIYRQSKEMGGSHHELRHRPIRLRNEGGIHGWHRNGNHLEAGTWRH